MDGSSCFSTRLYSAISSASPLLFTRSPQITTNLGCSRFTFAIANSKFAVSCLKFWSLAYMPNCGSDITTKNHGFCAAAALASKSTSIGKSTREGNELELKASHQLQNARITGPGYASKGCRTAYVVARLIEMHFIRQ